MKPEPTDEKEKEVRIQAYTLLQLAVLYGIPRKTCKKWIAMVPDIGPRVGHFYSPIQVRKIFDYHGMPGFVFLNVLFVAFLAVLFGTWVILLASQPGPGRRLTIWHFVVPMVLILLGGFVMGHFFGKVLFHKPRQASPVEIAYSTRP
jgi:hypothetical protein